MLLGTVTLATDEDTILDEVYDLTEPLVRQIVKYYNIEPFEAFRVREDRSDRGDRSTRDNFYLVDGRFSFVHHALIDPTFDSITNAIYLTRKTGVYYDVHINVVAVDPNQIGIRWATFDKPVPDDNLETRINTLATGFDLHPIYGVLINLPNEAPDLIVRGKHYDIEAYRQLVKHCPSRKMVLIFTSLVVSQDSTRIWFNNHIDDASKLVGEGECRLGKQGFFPLTTEEQNHLTKLRTQYTDQSNGANTMDRRDLKDLIRLSANYLVAWMSHGAKYEEAKQNLFDSIGLPEPDNLQPFVYHMLKTPQDLFIQLRNPNRLPPQPQTGPYPKRQDRPPRSGTEGGNRGRNRGRGRGGSHAKSQDRFG